MRMYISIVAAAMFFVASVASAGVTYHVVATAGNGDLLAMVPGETLTLDITMRSDGEALNGLGAAVYAYNGALTYVSGDTAANAFYSVCVAGTCYGGLSNSLASAGPTQNVGDEIQFFNGIAIQATTQTGANDVGIITGVAGDAQAQLVFTVNNSVTFGVGTNPAYADSAIGAGGATLSVMNETVVVTVIPEPGTALLMGLGLAGLAAAGRRE